MSNVVLAERKVRDEKIMKLHRKGMSGQQIGEQVGLSKNRVCSILRGFGLNLHASMAERYGCTQKELDYFMSTDPMILSAFNNHRWNARWRGIGFELTLIEWWDIWMDSGHWARRGKGRGTYCMSRFNDEGSYRQGNVEIVMSRVNTALGGHNRKQSNLPIGVYKRSSNRFSVGRQIDGKLYDLGFFATIEEAAAAYRAAERKEGLKEIIATKSRSRKKLSRLNRL